MSNMTDTRLTLEDWLDDLCVRFIINLPQEELESVERIGFAVEEAQWFYEDFVRPLDPTLPSLNLRNFCLRIFQHCPLLSQFSHHHHLTAFSEFLAYKTRVPVRGAILLDEALDKVVLVKGWKKGASWSFPRGKINKDEDDLDCAIREVYEETGYNIRDAGLVEYETDVKSIEVVMRDQNIRLFVFGGVPTDTQFEPQTRKEISRINWHRLSDLPTFKKTKQQHLQNGEGEDSSTNSNRYYMVAPFLVPLKKWIAKQKRLDAVKDTNAYATVTSSYDQPTTEEEIPIAIDVADSSGASHSAHSQLPELNDAARFDSFEASRMLKQMLSIQQPIQVSEPPPPPASDIGRSSQDKSNALLALIQKSERDVPHSLRSDLQPQTPHEYQNATGPQPGPPRHHHPHYPHLSGPPPHFPVAPTHSVPPSSNKPFRPPLDTRSPPPRRQDFKQSRAEPHIGQKAASGLDAASNLHRIYQHGHNSTRAPNDGTAPPSPCSQSQSIVDLFKTAVSPPQSFVYPQSSQRSGTSDSLSPQAQELLNVLRSSNSQPAKPDLTSELPQVVAQRPGSEAGEKQLNVREPPSKSKGNARSLHSTIYRSPETTRASKLASPPLKEDLFSAFAGGSHQSNTSRTYHQEALLDLFRKGDGEALTQEVAGNFAPVELSAQISPGYRTMGGLESPESSGSLDPPVIRARQHDVFKDDASAVRPVGASHATGTSVEGAQAPFRILSRPEGPKENHFQKTPLSRRAEGKGSTAHMGGGQSQFQPQILRRPAQAPFEASHQEAKPAILKRPQPPSIQQDRDSVSGSSGPVRQPQKILLPNNAGKPGRNHTEEHRQSLLSLFQGPSPPVESPDTGWDPLGSVLGKQSPAQEDRGRIVHTAPQPNATKAPPVIHSQGPQRQAVGGSMSPSAAADRNFLLGFLEGHTQAPRSR